MLHTVTAKRSYNVLKLKAGKQLLPPFIINQLYLIINHYKSNVEHSASVPQSVQSTYHIRWRNIVFPLNITDTVLKTIYT